MLTGLRGADMAKMRRRDRGFRVKFVGEAGDDYGGLYREAFTNLCAELQADSSELLQRCPNGQHSLGSNRSSFLARPSASSPRALDGWRMLGLLLGCALLQRDTVLDLELCEHVWKVLVGSPLDEADLAGFDDAAANSLRSLRHIDREGVDAALFGDLFFNCFEVELSDGSLVELCDGGAALPVTFHNRHAYCGLALAARLAEGRAGYAAMRSGVASIVPCGRLLALLTGKELERLACGVADIDLAALRRHTRYGVGVSPSQSHVKHFWSALEASPPFFSPAGRPVRTPPPAFTPAAVNRPSPPSSGAPSSSSSGGATGRRLGRGGVARRAPPF